jgi:hypothetical protein
MDKRKKTLEEKKKQCLIDFSTGVYTQRELAHRNKISLGLVSKITKDQEKGLEQAVNARTAAKSATQGLDEQSVHAIKEASNRQLKAIKIDDYLNGGIGIAAKVAVGILNSGEATMNDVVGFGKFQNDARVGIKTQEKFSQQIINNTNAQQNNEPLTINIVKAEEIALTN